jgi:mRNA interferase MazF
MTRGDIWTVAAGEGYAGKPRPVLVLQDDRFSLTGSITVCPFTTHQTEAPLFRLPVSPSDDNGLRVPCRLMVDKIVTVPRAKMGVRVGRLDDATMLRVNRAVVLFLGLAG